MHEKPSASQPSVAAENLVARAFLFTDVENSSRLMERAEAACKEALAYHDALLRETAACHVGQELAEAGDGFLFAFKEPQLALEAALELQRRIEATRWAPAVGALRVRVALGWGDVTPLPGEEYRGLILNRTARLLNATHGGQIVCGKAFADAIGRSCDLRELGWYHLRDLAEPEQVFQVEKEGMSRQFFPPLKTIPVVPCNLPRNFTKFFGREREIAAVCDLLRGDQSSGQQPRIVTLTGPGGTGKTRLSLEIAEQLRGVYSDAVWFVPLANLAEPALIPLALREELRLPTDATEEPLEQVTKFLAARPGLVLLDNFEQLLPQGADVLVSMLLGMPEVRWLISSRQRLSLPGEVEFPVEALETPQAECAPESLVHFSSVQLFADRAKTARPSFELSPANAPVIAELCRKLDGVPLAMELAASRSDVVAPAEMLKELNERFNLCATNDPAIPPRHRSLRAAIDWSYDFLPAALRDYFENLSVFRGGWSVDAAAAVAHSREVRAHAGETRRALAELRAASLLRAEEMNGAMRFHMLETIRQYAAEKLSNQPRSTRVRLLHVNFFAELAERMESELHGSEADHWMSRIDTDRENVRAALAYAAEPALIARLSTSLTPYWIARALVTEGRRWLAQSHANRESLPPKLRSAVLYCCGTLAVQQADWPAARDSFAAALHEFRLAGDQPNVAALLSNLGVVAANNQEFAQAERYFAESVASYAALHHPTREALALINLGTIHLDRSDTSAAAEAYDRALELSTSTGDQAARALALHGLAQVHFHAGSLPEARARAEESLALNKKLRLHPRLAQNALLLACISSKSGADLHNIARWLGAADWLTREMEALASLRLQAAVAELRTRLRGELGPTILARESTNGRRMAQSWCGDTN